MRIVIGAWELGDWSSDDAVVLTVGDRFDRGVADFRNEPVRPGLRAAVGAVLFDSIDAHTYNNARGPWRPLHGRITTILAVFGTSDQDGAPSSGRTADVRTTADPRALTADDFIVDVAPDPGAHPTA